MRLRAMLAMGSGVLVIGGGWWWATHRAPPPHVLGAPPARSASSGLPTVPAAPSSLAPAEPSSPAASASSLPAVPPAVRSGSAHGSALASYRAVSHNPAPPTGNGILTAPDPAHPVTTWAVVPEAVHEHGNATGTLWFGIRPTPHASWAWYPCALPGALPKGLPTVARTALQLAWDLSENRGGPSQLPGHISWKMVQGQVGVPAGWAFRSIKIPGIGIRTDLVVFMPAYSGRLGKWVEMVTTWNAHNVTTGAHALDLFYTSSQSLADLTSRAVNDPSGS